MVGSGYWGKNLVRNFHDLKALSAVCDSSEEALKRMSDAFPGIRTLRRFEAALADASIDAVAIATPAETHGKLARAAIEAGKDVFVEKPLCLDPAEGEDLVRRAAERGRILMVGHLLWYHPAVLKLRDLISAGALGGIRHIYSHRLNIGRIRREENILWSFAPHDVSVILGLVGGMPDSVYSQGGYYLSESIADVTLSMLSFRGGVQAHIFVSWLHPFKEQKLVVVGEKQMAVFDDLRSDDKLQLYPHTIEWKDEVPVARKAEASIVPLEKGEPLRAECSHFLDCVRDRSRPRTDGAEGLRVLSVLQRCEESLRANRLAAAAAVK